MKTKLPRSSRSLSATLAIAFLAVSVAALVIYGGLQALSNLSTQQDAIADELQIIAQGASQPVSNFIQNKFSILETSANLADLTKMTQNEQQQDLDSLLGLEPSFRRLILLSAQNQELANSSRLSRQSSGNLTDQLTSEVLEQIKQGNHYISSVYLDPLTSEPLVLMAIPVVNALGDFQGTLAAEVNLKFMWDLVDQLKVGDRGVAYVVDKQGNLIAFKDAARVLRGDNVANLEKVREYITGTSVMPFLDLTTGIQGIPVIGSYAPLGTPDWAVITEMPWDEAYRGAIQNVIASSAILVVMAILAGLLGVYLARRLAVPLVSLTDTASRISSGELELQADVRGPNEVARLATSFNSMTAQLRGLIGELEERVEARTAQLRASAEVSRAATSILNPDQLLKQVVALISERFGFYYTAVFVLDEDGQQAVLHAATGEAGQVLLERGHRLPVNGESMVGAVIVTSQPRIALDVGHGAVRFANPLLPNTRSEIALPLQVGDRKLGALDVQSEKPGAFDENNTEVLQTMADQIAVALLNAETFQRSEQQTHTMALLNQLSRALASATSLEDIAMTVLPLVNNLMGESYVAVVQKTANPQILALREFTTNPDRPVGDSEPIPTAGSLIGECIERGKAVYITDLSTLIDKYSDVANFYQQGLGSGATLPLRVGERVLGTLNVGTEQARTYSTELINQLEQIAAQLALTIENLNLVEQFQQTVAELDAANRQLVGQAWGQYRRTVKLEAAEWRNGDWSVREGRPAQREASQVLVSATPPLSLPIKVRGTTIGEFSITTADAQHSWDTEDMTFAQSLVDQVGQVLETARLLDETERSAQREKAVAEAADKIHRSTDIDTVLRSAVTELQRITGRRGISVQLGFGSTTSTTKRATVSKGEAARAAGDGQATSAEGDQANA